MYASHIDSLINNVIALIDTLTFVILMSKLIGKILDNIKMINVIYAHIIASSIGLVLSSMDNMMILYGINAIDILFIVIIISMSINYIVYDITITDIINAYLVVSSFGLILSHRKDIYNVMKMIYSVYKEHPLDHNQMWNSTLYREHVTSFQ
jgi:hypothetical protein